MVTPEAYLAFERASDEKHELIGGRILAMSGASGDHAAIATNIVIALGNALEGKPCRPYASDLKVAVESKGGYFYPDAMIVCGNRQWQDERRETLLNPTVVIEILSPSTERYDRVVKFGHYREIPTLREYILVTQSEPRIERFRLEGGNWIFDDVIGLESSLNLSSVAVEIPLARIYRDVEFTPDETETKLA